MSIQNVQSILPDPEWVKKVEETIARLEERVDRLESDLVEARR